MWQSTPMNVMDYHSTRGQAPAVGFEEALLRGLAPDGGLYVPEHWPTISSSTLAGFRGATFAEVAARLLAPYAAGAFDYKALHGLAEKAYGSFDHKAVAPLVRLGAKDFIMELHHGPTLAFKDVAMQFLGRLFDAVLERRDRRVSIIGATSGDTGAAAIEAFRGQDRVDVFILHPKGRVSEVQRRIMTSVQDENIHNIAIEGSFDDCQRIVKAMFRDQKFSESVGLGGVNSINWVRLAVQIVYYFTAIADYAADGERLSFVVPTGNFGDIFAGYAAKRMGAPMNTLCVAVNDNDILARAINTGEYQPRGVRITSSPSMDIQVASNFERLIYEAGGRNAEDTRAFIAAVDTPTGARMNPHTLAEIRRDFSAETADEHETAEAIAAHLAATDALIDPHTAVGVVALEKARLRGEIPGPAVVLSTAHPAKFPKAVKDACGREPALPNRFSDLYDRPEKLLDAANEVEAIKAIVRDRTRVGG
ncbi:MAG: threonine synthase [Pseudomonadota bacterium]